MRKSILSFSALALFALGAWTMSAPAGHQAKTSRAAETPLETMLRLGPGLPVESWDSF